MEERVIVVSWRGMGGGWGGGQNGGVAAGGWHRKLGDHISPGSRENKLEVGGRLEPSKPAPSMQGCTSSDSIGNQG